jgi:hypothetical protein
MNLVDLDSATHVTICTAVTAGASSDLLVNHIGSPRSQVDTGVLFAAEVSSLKTLGFSRPAQPCFHIPYCPVLR